MENVMLGVGRGVGGANDSLFGKIIEIDRENPLHKKYLKMTVKIWDF
jgi:hypothetical protein